MREYLKKNLFTPFTETLLTVLLSLSGIVLAILTYSALKGAQLNQTRSAVGFLIADSLLLLLLSGLIAFKFVRLWLKNKKNISGSKLHFRFTLLFGLMAITPSASMTVFSALFFHYGLESWFSKRLHLALDESLEVASSYLEEHKHSITQDARAMAEDIGRNHILERSELKKHLTALADLRNLKEALIFDERFQIMGRSDLTIALEFEPVLEEAVYEANKGHVALVKSVYPERVRALVQLTKNPRTYLYVGRFIDPKVLEHLKAAQESASHYQALSNIQGHMEITFILSFLVISLLLLMGSVWLGLRVADRLVHPIEELMQAAYEMGKGNLTIRVKESSKVDEIHSLKRSFNRLATQIQQQHSALEERRYFIESILASVPAGVLSLSKEGLVLMANPSASDLLHKDVSSFYNKSLSLLEPIFGEVFLEGANTSFGSYDKEIIIGERRRSFHIYLRQGHEGLTYVMTFQDLTEFLTAQKKAAWTHVARQIAHEIKNPLTPIQLVTDRLIHKFLPQINENKNQFEGYVETISKYVKQIGRLIDEFSSFARMPTAKLHTEDLTSICQKAIHIQEMAYPSVRFISILENGCTLDLDEDQILQAITNLLKNALEALEEVPHPEIHITLHKKSNHIILDIEDNGPGLPQGILPEDLIRPYTSSSKKGSGLGLAIVQKIMEDHKGSLSLSNRVPHGCKASLMFEVYKTRAL